MYSHMLCERSFYVKCLSLSLNVAYSRTRRIGSITDYDPINDQYGSIVEQYPGIKGSQSSCCTAACTLLLNYCYVHTSVSPPYCQLSAFVFQITLCASQLSFSSLLYTMFVVFVFSIRPACYFMYSPYPFAVCSMGIQQCLIIITLQLKELFSGMQIRAWLCNQLMMMLYYYCDVCITLQQQLYCRILFCSMRTSSLNVPSCFLFFL